MLDRIALQALADEGKGPGAAPKPQGHQGLGAALGWAAGHRQLLLQITAEVNAAAVVQQAFQPVDGGGVLLGVAAQVAIAAGHGEAIEPFAADQPLLAPHLVLLKEEIPAHVVKDQLQRPHPQLTSGAACKAAHAGVALQQHAAVFHDCRLDRLGAAGCGQRIAAHQLGVDHRMAGIAAHRRQPISADAGPAQPFIQLGQQVLGRWISQPAGRLLHHVVHLPQPGWGEHRGAQAVAVAHVVVAVAEAVGGEELLEVLAQGGCFARQIGAGDRFCGRDQVLMQVAAALGWPVKGHLQQVAQQRHHPHKHRPIAHGRQPAMDGPGGTRWWRQLNR